LLHDFFKDKGFCVIQAVGDANTVIVQTALDEAQCHTVTVAADDTDIHMLLLYHESDQLHDIHLLSQTANNKTGKCPCISIREVQKEIGTATMQTVASRTCNWWVRHIRNFWNGKKYYISKTYQLN